MKYEILSIIMLLVVVMSGSIEELREEKIIWKAKK